MSGYIGKVELRTEKNEDVARFSLCVNESSDDWPFITTTWFNCVWRDVPWRVSPFLAKGASVSIAGSLRAVSIPAGDGGYVGSYEVDVTVGEVLDG